MEKLNFCGFSGISVKTNSSKTFSGRGHFILGRGTKIGVAFFKAAQSMTILSYRTWYDHFCQISISLTYIAAVKPRKKVCYYRKSVFHFYLPLICKSSENNSGSASTKPFSELFIGGPLILFAEENVPISMLDWAPDLNTTICFALNYWLKIRFGNLVRRALQAKPYFCYAMFV